MRIAYLTADFGVPVLGNKGASVHVRKMVTALAELGHDLLVITPNRGGPSVGAGVPDEPNLPARLVEIPLLGSWPAFLETLKRERMCRDNRLAQDLRNLFYALALEAEAWEPLAQFQPDMLYERYSLFGTAGRRLAQRLDLPHLLEVNAPLVVEQTQQRGLSLPDLAQAAEHFVFNSADELLVVSRWLADYAAEHGAPRDRVTVLPNAADPEHFRPRSEPSPIRRRLGWTDRFVVGFCGSMKSWHGVAALLEALEHLGGAESEFRLVLVGDGPELPRLQEHVRRRGLDTAVHFSGAVPHERVPDWLASMHVAVAPYAANASGYFSPVKLFEYMAMGLPVVAARIEQTAELIDDDRTGWLYPPGDARALAGRLDWLAENRQAAAAVGTAARQMVLARHTWRRNAETVVSLSERAVRRREMSPVISTVARTTPAGRPRS